MKRRIFFAILLIAAAWVAGRWMSGRHASEGGASGREEINRTFELRPGARVEVRGINGPVTVETTDAMTAEVHVVRSAKSDSDLKYQKVYVEQTSSGLVVRGEGSARGFWRRIFGGGPVRQEVTLKLPRGASFAAHGINGPVRAGEVGGAFELTGINGSVELAQEAARAQLSGINGEVSYTFARLGDGGVEMSGINGNVEFRLKEAADADVEINGLNGGVTFNLPNVTSQERSRGSHVSARFGAGGADLDMSGINGNVKFLTATP